MAKSEKTYKIVVAVELCAWLHHASTFVCLVIQGVHKIRVHFKRFITLFVFAIKIISKKCYKV